MKRMNSSWLIMVSLLVIGLLTWSTPAASEDTPGVWNLTGSMATSRRHSSLERLSDGRILVVGGANTTGVDGAATIFCATAEIYDPATGTWTAAGSLKTGPRVLHTLTALWGGKTLVTGGWNGKAALSSAEIYDLNKGTFSATGSMKKARAEHREIMLFDGRVLITGGFDSSGAPIASAELYDPATGTFSETKGGPMTAARTAHRMNTVGEGKVLVTGGFGAGGEVLATAELFDPKTETFTLLAASLAHARANHSASELPTGEILVIGGNSGSGVLDSTEFYDPDTKIFTAGPTLNQARQSHSARLLPNGLVLISGGNNNPSGDWDIQTSFLSSAELYDLSTNKFTMTGSKNNPTSGGNSHLLWTGKVLATGGGTNEAELYTPEMPGTPETWVATGNMITARNSPTYSIIDDGRVLITGGLDSAGNPLASAELYDYLTGNFSLTIGAMTTPRQHHRIAPLYTGKLLVTGGRPSSSGVLNSAELYDPVDGTFTRTTENMLKYRRLHRSTPLPNGKVLIAGGLGGISGSENFILGEAELYDPAEGTFTFTAGNMIIPRYNHQAILLYTGKVLIAGGYMANPSPPPNSVLANAGELYDPATDSFTVTGNMATPRTNPFFTRLPNGKVLISSGADDTGTPIQSLEIYDPATGLFTSAGNGLAGRDGNRVSRLDNGKTILIGGKTAADNASVTNSAELYDHISGTCSDTGSLITGRRNFAHWNLPNGRILVAGGLAANGTTLSSAELYTPLIADEIDTMITSGPAALANSTNAEFIFTSTAPGSTFECSLDDASFAECKNPKSYSRLKSGKHNFKVRATYNRKTDPTPASFDWKIDTKAPQTIITSSPPKLTNNNVATFSFTSSEGGDKFECSLDGLPFTSCGSPYTSLPLAEGPHAFQVRAIDEAGNADKSPAKAKKWTVDTTRPNTFITVAPANLTTSTTAKFKFKSDEKKCTFECNLDGKGFTACKSSQSYTGLSISIEPHTLEVRATDAAGNTDLTPASWSWTIGTTP